MPNTTVLSGARANSSIDKLLARLTENNKQMVAWSDRQGDTGIGAWAIPALARVEGIAKCPAPSDSGGVLSMPLLVIRNWAELFENNRTRELKKLDWLPLPNDLSSDGYTELITHKRGPSHFAVWIVLLQLASRCEPRGFLLRSNGLAHDFGSISRVTRIPVKLIEEAVQRLLDIGWLETKELSGEISHPAAAKPQEPDASRARVPEGKERREENAPTYAQPDAEACGLPVDRLFDAAEVFLRMWARHPKRSDRILAEQVFTQLLAEFPVDPAGRARQIEQGHATWCASDDWQREGGRFAPKLVNFLRSGDWAEVPRGANALEDGIRSADEVLRERSAHVEIDT